MCVFVWMTDACVRARARAREHMCVSVFRCVHASPLQTNHCTKNKTTFFFYPPRPWESFSLQQNKHNLLVSGRSKGYEGCRGPGTYQSLAHRTPLLILSAVVLVVVVVVVVLIRVTVTAGRKYKLSSNMIVILYIYIYIFFSFTIFKPIYFS